MRVPKYSSPVPVGASPRDQGKVIAVKAPLRDRQSGNPARANGVPPRAPQSRAKIVVRREEPGRISPPTKVTSLPTRSIEQSRPGTRQRLSKSSSPPVIQNKKMSAIDPSKLTTGRGGYTIEQLKAHLAEMGLKKTGNKAELVERLTTAMSK